MLALLLVLSALPFTASAAGAQPERNVRTRDQDGYISLHQYITPTDEEDVFQVKMSVRAYLDEPIMDIVYVIDNSLEVAAQWDDIMDGLKAAGEMFLTPEKNPQDKLGADQVRLSVVFFNGKASVLTDLTGSATPTLSGSYYVSEAVDSASTGTTPPSITSPKSTNNYDRKGYDQFVKDVEAAKLSSSPFNPNNSSAATTKEFKQRYTAKGLGQAYDYLTWQKDEYVNDAANQYLTNKNYNDRAVVFLVSGGGDHLEDFTATGDIKQNATATAADITGNTMSNVLQEGVLRREAILVAKALKANRKTYADFNGAFTTTGTAPNTIYTPKGFDLVTHQLRSSSKARSGNYVDEVTASKEDRNKKTTGASPAAVDDNPANVFFVNKNLKLRIDADEPVAPSGLAPPDQDGLAILLDNSDREMTGIKGVYENIYTYGGMQAEIRSLGIDFLSTDKPTTSSNNEKGSQEHVNNYLALKKGGAPNLAWAFSSYDDAQYEASANQLLANADKGGPTQTSKNANGQTTNLKTGGAAAHAIRGERDYGVLLTTGYRLTFEDLLPSLQGSSPMTNANYPGPGGTARPNPPIQDNPMKDNPYYTSLAKGQGPIAGTTGDWNPDGYYGSISGSALSGYSQNWAYTWVWRPSALNTNTAVPGGKWGAYTEGGSFSGNSYNDGPAWLGNDVNPWNFLNGSGGLWYSNTGHAQAIINASDPNGNNTIQPSDKNWFHRMVTRPSIVDIGTNTGGTVMDYNTHSVSGLTNGASLSGSDWATGVATGDVNAGTVPLTASTTPNNFLGQSMQGDASTGDAIDIQMTGINTSWPSHLIHNAYNSGQQATYGIGSSSFMQPWVLNYTGVTIAATSSSPDDDFSYPTVNGKTTTTLTSSTVGDGDMVNGVRNKHNDWVSEYMMVLAGDYDMSTGSDSINYTTVGGANDWSDTWWTWGSRMVSAEVISNGTKAVGYWSYTPYTYETFGYDYVYQSQTLASGIDDPYAVLTPGTPPYSPTWQETASSTVVNIFARNLAYNYSHKEWNYYEQIGATLKMDGYYKAVHDFEKNTANVKAEGDTLSDYPLYYRYADQNNSTGINTDNNANERQIVYQMKKYAYELYRAANSAYVEAKLSEHFKITKFPGEPMFKIGYSEITIPTVYMDGVGTAVQDGDDTIKWNLDGVYQGAEYMLIFYVHMENRDKLMADTYYPVMDYSYCEMNVRSMFYNGGRRGTHGSGRYATYSQLKHFEQIYVNGKGVVKSDEVEDPKATPTQMLSGVVLPGVFNATLTPTPTSITQIVSDSLEEKDVAVPVTRDNDAKATWAIGGIVVLLAAASSVVLFKNRRKKEDR